MSAEKEKFLEAIQSASEVAASLESLQTEVINYKLASDELDKVRQNLSRFIDKVEIIAVDMKEAIKVIQSISGPEILAIQRQINSNLQKQSEALRSAEKQLSSYLEKIVVDTKEVTKVTEKIAVDINEATKEIQKQIASNQEKLLGDLQFTEERFSSSMEKQFNDTYAAIDKLKTPIAIAAIGSVLAVILSIFMIFTR